VAVNPQPTSPDLSNYRLSIENMLQKYARKQALELAKTNPDTIYCEKHRRLVSHRSKSLD
jgi:hypothetical protein